MTLDKQAELDGRNAVLILENIRAYRREEPDAFSMRVGFGGWFDCECGECIQEGHDTHAWDAFEQCATDAIHYACVLLAQRDFEQAAQAQQQRNQLARFNPDWNMLAATQESLREHMALIIRLRQALDTAIRGLGADLDRAQRQALAAHLMEGATS